MHVSTYWTFSDVHTLNDNDSAYGIMIEVICMWQSRVEIEHHYIAHFKHFTNVQSAIAQDFC